MFKRLRSQAGAALVEYSLLVAGIALIGSASVSLFGHEVNDMMAATAAILPGAHADDNNPIVSGKIIETSTGATGNNSAGTATTPAIGLDIGGIIANSNTVRLGNNLGADTSGGGTPVNLGDLVLEP